ncbi:hypothetical protein C5O80_10760 [Burkholderia sp. SRS-46]|nr:hypothetical protein C5O80_10760 [Burkholderia sp. SRS-46]
MGLYLCVFDGDEEVDGVEVGHYADFNNIRSYVVRELEGGQAGRRYPAFIMHADSDGEWDVSECKKLKIELEAIMTAMKGRPALEFTSDWQRFVATKMGVAPRNAFESFIDVDGEFVLERIDGLVDVALQRGLPILFQ